jgi:hypothetical protein
MNQEQLMKYIVKRRRTKVKITFVSHPNANKRQEQKITWILLINTKKVVIR